MKGTVLKRPRKNGKPSWGYSFFAGRDKDGKRIQVTRSGFEKRGEAEDALRAAIAEYQAGATITRKDARTFEAYFLEWLGSKYDCSPKTIERYRELGQYAIRKFGAVELRRLKPMMIKTAVAELLEHGGRPDKEHPAGRPLSVKTVREIFFLVSSCYQEAINNEIVAANPMDRVKLPKPVASEPTVLEREQLDQLLQSAAGTRLFPLLVLAAATGCRRGELLALTWADVNFDTGKIQITKSLEETKRGLRVKSTKSGEPRKFGVPGQALEVLKEHREQQLRDRQMFGPDYIDRGLVFCRPEGEYYKPDKVSVRVTELATKAGLPGVGLHSLRHTHCSHLISQGVPITSIATRLGHASPNVTLQIYAHSLEKDEHLAAQHWNNALGGIVEKNRKAAQDRMLANVSAKTPKPDDSEG